MKLNSLRWDTNEVPYSVVFDDKYFCTDNGYEDALHVFCRGNRLEERFAALDASVSGEFVIVETGFGTGLDCCTAWVLWDRSAPLSWRLHFISLERYPLNADDIRRALARWPEVSLAGDLLARQYQPCPGRVGQWILSEGRVKLTLVFDEVVPALDRIRAEGLVPQGADAFFLDGFAPAKNPGMWTPEVFQRVALLARPGTTFATFTVAGAVRRGLAEAGFKVERLAGYGKKRTILTGVYQ